MKGVAFILITPFSDHTIIATPLEASLSFAKKKEIFNERIRVLK